MCNRHYKDKKEEKQIPCKLTVYPKDNRGEYLVEVEGLTEMTYIADKKYSFKVTEVVSELTLENIVDKFSMHLLSGMLQTKQKRKGGD